MTRPNEESPSVRGGGFQETLQNTNAKSIAPPEKIGNFQEKRLATLKAQFALAGHQVHRLEDGFLVCRWGMSRHCPDLAALVAFGRVLGVQS